MKLNFESVKILNNKEIQEQKFEWNNWYLPTTIHNTYIYNLEGFFILVLHFSFTTTTITTTTFILSPIGCWYCDSHSKFGIKVSIWNLLRHVQLIYYILFLE